MPAACDPQRSTIRRRWIDDRERGLPASAVLELVGTRTDDAVVEIRPRADEVRTRHSYRRSPHVHRGRYTLDPDAAVSVTHHVQDAPSRLVRRLRRDVPLAMLDFALVFPAYLAPLALRFDGRIQPLLAQLLAVRSDRGRDPSPRDHFFGLYGQMWRYASIQEARRLVLAGVSAILLISTGVRCPRSGARRFPLSTVVFGGVLALTAFGAVRFQSRLFGFRRRTVEAMREYTRDPDGRGGRWRDGCGTSWKSSLDRTRTGRDRR